MSLAYLKGMRTRHVNLIAKELEKTKALHTQVNCAEDDEISAVRRKVSTTRTKLKEYSSKLESTCEKLAVEIEDIEDENEKKFQGEEEEKTTNLIGITLETTCELSELENELLERKKEGQNKLEKLFEIQTQLMEI